MPNINYKEIKNFFRLLQSAYKKKKKFFVYPFVTSRLLSVLSILQQSAFILGYYQINNREIQIYLRYDAQSLPVLNSIYFFPSLRYVTVKMLKRFANDYPYSLLLVNTRYGVLNNKDCQKQNCGGELIIAIS
jgi:ribosomal protein S8